jgi:glutamine cyclotransferase
MAVAALLALGVGLWFGWPRERALGAGDAFPAAAPTAVGVTPPPPAAVTAARLAGSPAAAAAVSEPERLVARVVARWPHDPGCYTQGLLWHAGKLLESCGQYGTSELREVEPESGRVLRRVALPRHQFAEGLALVDDRLFQLTWREEQALLWNLADFRPAAAPFAYRGEGWGLCYDGRRLVMSDGSDRLVFRDPTSFAALGEVRVTLSGRAIADLNELECVDDQVWANVWQTDWVLRIDAETGRVRAVLDAQGLLTAAERQRSEVLNGIAWDGAAGRLLLTGKYWPWVFVVEAVPAA